MPNGWPGAGALAKTETASPPWARAGPVARPIAMMAPAAVTLTAVSHRFVIVRFVWPFMASPPRSRARLAVHLEPVTSLTKGLAGIDRWPGEPVRPWAA